MGLNFCRVKWNVGQERRVSLGLGCENSGKCLEAAEADAATQIAYEERRVPLGLSRGARVSAWTVNENFTRGCYKPG